MRREYSVKYYLLKTRNVKYRPLFTGSPAQHSQICDFTYCLSRTGTRGRNKTASRIPETRDPRVKTSGVCAPGKLLRTLPASVTDDFLIFYFRGPAKQTVIT